MDLASLCDSYNFENVHHTSMTLTPQARVRQHKLKLPKTSGMSGLGLDVMAGGSIFDSDVVDTPSMALVDPVLGGQVSRLAFQVCLVYWYTGFHAHDIDVWF